MQLYSSMKDNSKNRIVLSLIKKPFFGAVCFVYSLPNKIHLPKDKAAPINLILSAAQISTRNGKDVFY